MGQKQEASKRRMHPRAPIYPKEKRTSFLTFLIENCCFRSTKCEYLDGSCLASPRWVSLLVAEIYYPDATFPNPANANPSQNRSPVQGVNPPNVSPSTAQQTKLNTKESKVKKCYQIRKLPKTLLLLLNLIRSDHSDRLF